MEDYVVNMSPTLEKRLDSFERILERLEKSIDKLNVRLDTLEKGSDETHAILYKNRELYTGLMKTIQETETADIKVVLEELHKNNEILLSPYKKRMENIFWRQSGIGIVKNILSP